MLDLSLVKKQEESKMANEENLKPVKTHEEAVERGRKGGLNKRGSKHISTWIQEMLNDEEFEANILDSRKGMIEFKGAPLKAIINVAVQKAINDPKTGQQWAEWLAKHGYGSKLVLETSDPLDRLLGKFGIEEGDDAGKVNQS